MEVLIDEELKNSAAGAGPTFQGPPHFAKDAMKAPAFQFYPGDYLSDAVVEMMSLQQQGAYMRLLCHAWRSTSVGRLFNNDAQLALLARMTPQQWEEDKGPILAAFRLDADGWFTQKRLVAEFEKQEVFRKQRVKAGKNSAKKRATSVERSFNETPTKKSFPVERKANSISSSSSSSSDKKNNTPLPPKTPGELDVPAFHAAWARWLTHRRETGKPVRAMACEAQIAKCRAMGAVRAVAMIEHSIAGGYQGLYEPKFTGENHDSSSAADRRREQKAAREYPEQLTFPASSI